MTDENKARRNLEREILKYAAQVAVFKSQPHNRRISELLRSETRVLDAALKLAAQLETA